MRSEWDRFQRYIKHESYHNKHSKDNTNIMTPQTNLTGATVQPDKVNQDQGKRYKNTMTGFDKSNIWLILITIGHVTYTMRFRYLLILLKIFHLYLRFFDFQKNNLFYKSIKQIVFILCNREDIIVSSFLLNS